MTAETAPALSTEAPAAPVSEHAAAWRTAVTWLTISVLRGTERVPRGVAVTPIFG